MLPENTILGDVKMLEVYEYFDGPKIFLAQAKDGTKYLVYWCNMVSNGYAWLYMPVSEELLAAMYEKKIGLHQAYANHNGSFYYVITGTRERVDEITGQIIYEAEDSVTEYPATEINREWLVPANELDDDFYIEYIDPAVMDNVIDNEYTDYSIF